MMKGEDMTKEEAIKYFKNAKGLSSTFDKAADLAISALSTDKVEVVRCKECKWNTHYPFCNIDRNDDFFCADGEKE